MQYTSNNGLEKRGWGGGGNCALVLFIKILSQIIFYELTILSAHTHDNSLLFISYYVASTQPTWAESTLQPQGSTPPTITLPSTGCMGAKWWLLITKLMVHTTAISFTAVILWTLYTFIHPTHTDLPMQHYMSVFKQNGGCGYILKPQVANFRHWWL